MNITTNCHRCLYELSVGLVGEDFFGFLYNKFDLLLGDGLKGFQVVNNHIEIIIILGHSGLEILKELKIRI